MTRQTHLLNPREALIQAFDPESLSQDSDTQEQMQLRLGYQIADLHFLIKPETTAEVMEFPQITQLPNTATWCLGLTQIRSNLIPVFKIHSLLQHKSDKKPWLLILGDSDDAAALVIDGLPYTLNFDQASTPAKINNLANFIEPFIEQQWLHQNIYHNQLDHFALFSHLSQQVSTPTGFNQGDLRS